MWSKRYICCLPNLGPNLVLQAKILDPKKLEQEVMFVWAGISKYR